MAKEGSNQSNYLKRQTILTWITLILVLVCCILGFVNACSSKKEEEEETKYDVSMMHTVGVQDVLEMFDDEKTYILYIGRETCDVCVDLLPTLQQAQIENNYMTQYLDITQVDFNSSAWAELVEKLDYELETTMTNSDGEREVVTNTFGYFLNSKGYTPCVILIKNGKQVSGFFGNYSSTAYEDWLSENGI